METTYKKITLKKGKEESLSRRHPWVFSGAVARMDPGIIEGDRVVVESYDGRMLGVGHFQIGSITVRMLSHGSDRSALDPDFFAHRLQEALRLRHTMGLLDAAKKEETNCFRLVHGEGDYLPGLVVDIYGKTAVMQAHSPGMHMERMKIAQSLTELEGLSVANVYYKSETTLPYKADLGAEDGYLIGGLDGSTAMENGLKFHIDWLRGQKTGFFLDQRDNRSLLGRYAQGKKVLNMFCYTGGFSVYALAGGAKKVDSVDSSAKAVALTEANVEDNFGADSRHRAYAVDAFKFLADMEKDAYDLIVLDPPAFAKHRNALKRGLLGYRRLNAKAFEKIRPGGLLFTFSCSQVVTKEQFRLAVFSAAMQAGRKVRILHQLTQPADHPIDICHPEGEYLKGLVLYVE